MKRCKSLLVGGNENSVIVDFSHDHVIFYGNGQSNGTGCFTLVVYIDSDSHNIR